MGIPGGKIRNWNFFSSLDIIDLIISKDFSPFYQPLIQYSHFRPFFRLFLPKNTSCLNRYFERDRTGLNRFREKKTKIESCLWPGERVLKVEIILHQMVNVGSQIKWTYWEVKCHFFIKFLITKYIFKNFDPMILFLKENKKINRGKSERVAAPVNKTLLNS